ncbi:hypothetical protein TNCV_1462661 [Trichonephila clavipes]|nr:hypothetical protein TNCV_1462661 [Trichonephila clavipes]
MRARNYYAHPNIRDHCALRCMKKCSDLMVSEERPSVFKTPSKLGTHLSTNAEGMKGRVTLAQPVNRTQTYGVEARYTTT